jgi:PPOX class probable F420-dependent enzyme
MTTGPLPERVQEFLAAPRPSVVATVRADGTPASTPCWYECFDGSVLLSAYATAVRLHNLQRNPAVSLTVFDLDDWYTHVNLLGPVTSITGDDDLVDADRLSERYTGKPFEPRVPCTSVRFGIERWHTYGRLKQ